MEAALEADHGRQAARLVQGPHFVLGVAGRTAAHVADPATWLAGG